MMRSAFTRLGCAMLVSGCGWSQVADVHPSAPTPLGYVRKPLIEGGRYQVRNATVADLIAAAYNVSVDRVWGGPSWLEWDRFDVIAKLPGTDEKPSVVLRQILADRFKLVVHDDSKAMPAFALTAGKRTALVRSEGKGEEGCKYAQDPGPVDAQHPMIWGYTCRNVTMAEFADSVPEIDSSLRVPVVDKTGLSGKWDFGFKMTFRVPNAAAGVPTSLFEAMEKLGLTLERTTVPRPVVVVDSVNRVPTPNAPNISEMLPPPATEFEVATLKPSDPNSNQTSFQIQPGGRVNVRGMPLNFLVAMAWQLSPNMVSGGPSWMSADRWDVVAKAPAGSVAASGFRADNDAVWPMMRTLLAERFKLEAHFDDKPVEAYTLLAGKPRLKAADPGARTKCEEVPSSGDKDDPRNRNPAASRLIRCQNMTVTQFAEQLQRISQAYFRYPVLDLTGIQGSFDFLLNFSTVGVALGGRGEQTDPNGGITLPEAIEKQLGLKVELRKRPVKVLVIDHIEQKPKEN